MRVTNGIPLGCSLLLPVDTVNRVQTLKSLWLGTERSAHHAFCHCTDRVQTLKSLMLGTVRSTHHVFCHCTDRVQTLKARKRLWVGGTESNMFNRLEEIAFLDTPTTPVLGCQISSALQPRFMGSDKKQYLRSRINWAYGARFPTEIYTRGCHWIPRMFA
jgi:hypothetical protein